MTPEKSAASPDPKEPADFARRLDNYFLTCSAFAGAAALLAAPNAEAAIVYSGVKNAAVPFNNSAGLSIDLDTGAFSTTEEIAGFDLDFNGTRNASSTRLNFTAGRASADGADAKITITKSSSSSSSSSSFTTVGVNKLKAGKVISAKRKFAQTGPLGAVTASSSSSSSSSSRGAGAPSASGAWGKGGSGYVGFRFVSAANTTLYGWVQLAVDASLQTTVVDWAYETSGQPIVAGQALDTSVSVSLKQPTATEGGAPAKIKFVRTGDKNVPLKVHYQIKSTSTAVSGVDYQPLAGNIIIPAGKKSVTLQISALDNSVRDGTHTLALKLLPGFGYNIGKPKGGSVVITDND